MSVDDEKAREISDGTEETWIEVKRRTRTQKARMSRQMILIFVKVNGLKESLLDVSITDTVGDSVRKIPNSECSNKQDVYMMCKGRVLRWNDELRCSGIRDGCTVLIMSKMHGEGKHRNKKNKVEKKPATCLQSQEPVRDQQKHDEEKITQSLLSHENAEDAVIRHFEETEEARKIIADLVEGSNSDLEQRLQIYTELTGLNEERKKTNANGIRRAVEARRRDTGREPTAEQEQGKKVRVIEKEKEAQEAREWQEQFVEKRRRAHEARMGDQQKQQRQEEQEQTTRQEHGKKVRFGEEERSEETKVESTDEPEVMSRFAEVRRGRGSDGLVRGREYWCQTNETNGKGKGKGEGGKREREGKGDSEAKGYTRSRI